MTHLLMIHPLAADWTTPELAVRTAADHYLAAHYSPLHCHCPGSTT
jgi:hypothetical protein